MIKNIILIFLFSFLGVHKGYTTILSFDVSDKTIIINENSIEPDFIIYGYTDSNDFLVLKIQGPKQKVILQKKKKILNMWTWNKTGEFTYSGLSHYYTNNQDKEIDFEIKKDLVDNIKLLGKDDDNLKRDLIEKKRSIGLFLIKNNSFVKVNEKIPNFFKIPIKLPKNAPVGEYLVSMSVKGKANSYEISKTKIFVNKLGISSFIYKLAHKFSFIYGLFSAIIAIGLGFLAGIVFKKS